MKRVIARLDVKGENVIKGVHLEGLKIIDTAKNLSFKYAKQDIDEIYFHDSVASLYERNNLTNIIEEVSANINIPLTVGGGIKKVEDIEKILISGADKVSINTKFIEDVKSVSKFTKKFGSQAIVGSIEAKFLNNDWYCFTDNGRNLTNKKVKDWIINLQNEGVGELIITSVDMEGTKKGFDYNLLEAIQKSIKIPLIVSGGIGKYDDIKKCFDNEIVTGVAIASIVHNDSTNFDKIKKNCNLEKRNIPIFNIKKNKQKVSILKTKICNFRSLYNSLRKICEVEIIDDVSKNNYDKVILPGVGSFPEIMSELKGEKKKFVENFVKKGNPILGICLGAQAFFSNSFEITETKGLNLIKGFNKHLKNISNNENLVVPHIGWSKIDFKEHDIFNNLEHNCMMYFIHSYNFVPNDNNLIFAKSPYGSCNINAVCIKDNIIACQFHPEKSGISGLVLLENFSNLD